MSQLTQSAGTPTSPGSEAKPGSQRAADLIGLAAVPLRAGHLPAMAIASGVRSLGIEVRTGLHTGECELMGDKISGIAVHTGARVAAQAAPSEVLVSGTVRDLVAGSGLQFEDRGTRSLKGLPGEWHLFAVMGGTSQ